MIEPLLSFLIFLTNKLISKLFSKPIQKVKNKLKALRIHTVKDYETYKRLNSKLDKIQILETLTMLGIWIAYLLTFNLWFIIDYIKVLIFYILIVIAFKLLKNYLKLNI